MTTRMWSTHTHTALHAQLRIDILLYASLNCSQTSNQDHLVEDHSYTVAILETRQPIDFSTSRKRLSRCLVKLTYVEIHKTKLQEFISAPAKEQMSMMT
jgi:hypothetical protein